MSTTQRVNPLNKEEEKRKFFFDPLYNPQFEYAEDILADEFTKYGGISNQFLSQAKVIIDLVIKKYGSEEKYVEAIEGRILTRQEVEDRIRHYLQSNNLEKEITTKFSFQFVSRTSIKGNELNIRLPLEYGEEEFSSVLHHEIGTHYFRTLNEKKRPWYKNRKKYDLASYTETEEGLAIIHQFMVLSDPSLWRSAIYYYACWLGSQMSFADLNKELSPYIHTPERRWKTCVRVKRGLKDTSQPGAFSHDQVYLSGVIQVMKWLEEHDYDPTPLYIGKIGLADINRVLHLIQKDDIILPTFLNTLSKEEYRKAIHLLKKVNKLD